MADHLQYQGDYIESYTLHGAKLVELLDLADNKRREHREFILSALGIFLKTRNELLGYLSTPEAGRENAWSVEGMDLDVAIRKTTEELEKVERFIELLTGEQLRRAPAA